MDEERKRNLSALIEAFLFVEGGAITNRKLAELAGCKDAELSLALDALSSRLHGSGIALIRTETEASLTASPETAQVIRNVFELELGREIGDAGLEVLAIIIYHGPSTRSEIDYIRGVNTSSTLRALLARGLVTRINNPKDSREYLYNTTAELMAHLGVDDVKKLPDYAKITGELASFVTKQGPTEEQNGDSAANRNHVEGE